MTMPNRASTNMSIGNWKITPRAEDQPHVEVEDRLDRAG